MVLISKWITNWVCVIRCSDYIPWNVTYISNISCFSQNGSDVQYPLNKMRQNRPLEHPGFTLTKVLPTREHTHLKRTLNGVNFVSKFHPIMSYDWKIGDRYYLNEHGFKPFLIKYCFTGMLVHERIFYVRFNHVIIWIGVIWGSNHRSQYVILIPFISAIMMIKKTLFSSLCIWNLTLFETFCVHGCVSQSHWKWASGPESRKKKSEFEADNKLALNCCCWVLVWFGFFGSVFASVCVGVCGCVCLFGLFCFILICFFFFFLF